MTSQTERCGTPERDDTLPSSWCVVACEMGCGTTWTVDTAEFTPPLNTSQVEQLLTPLLIAHEVEHGRW